MDEFDDLAADWEELPRGTHAAVLTGCDVVSGMDLAYPVVWADRSYDKCPQCRQSIERVPSCPVVLNTGAGAGGRIEEFSQQHGCGEWLWVDWDEVDDLENVPVVAQRLADRLGECIDNERAKLRAGLITQLRDALARRDEPLDTELGETIDDRVDEVATRSEVDPGVYIENRWADRSEWVWCAWDYDPAGLDEEGICVRVADLQAAEASA